MAKTVTGAAKTQRKYFTPYGCVKIGLLSLDQRRLYNLRVCLFIHAMTTGLCVLAH